MSFTNSFFLAIGFIKPEWEGESMKIAVKECPNCYALVCENELMCDHCGHYFFKMGDYNESR